MSRYIIWDEQSDVYTPSGAVYTAQEWLDKYPVAKLPTEKLVLLNSVYNGSYCGVLSVMVANYSKGGCDFAGCETEQDYLDAMEAFEDARNAEVQHEVTDATRTADALEDLVLLQEFAVEGGIATEAVSVMSMRSTSKSPQYDHMKERWDHNRISESMLRKYVIGKRITAAEFTEITGLEY